MPSKKSKKPHRPAVENDQDQDEEVLLGYSLTDIDDAFKGRKGRPKTEIKLSQVETLASIGCTLEEIAAVVGVSKRTLIRRGKEEDFAETLERGGAGGRASLRRSQWKSALEGNVTAQIWLGKQMLGQRSFEREDKKDPAAVTLPPLIIETYDPDNPAPSGTAVDSPEQGFSVPGEVPGTGSRS